MMQPPPASSPASGLLAGMRARRLGGVSHVSAVNDIARAPRVAAIDAPPSGSFRVGACRPSTAL